MVSATILHSLLEGPLKDTLALNHWGLMKIGLKKIVTAILTFAILATISLCQVYLARNFVHQCICGAAFGVVVSRRLNYFQLIDRITKCTKKTALTFGISAIVLSVVTYLGAYLIREDPRWTIHKVRDMPIVPKSPKTISHHTIFNPNNSFTGLQLVQRSVLYETGTHNNILTCSWFRTSLWLHVVFTNWLRVSYIAINALPVRNVTNWACKNILTFVFFFFLFLLIAGVASKRISNVA